MRDLVLGAFGALCALAGCGAGPSSSAPTGFPVPTPAPTDVVMGHGTGPTRITFVSADPPPSSSVSGCGPDATGCPGRVRMVFRLSPSGTGPVLHFVVFLHSSTKRACFAASTAPFGLRAGEDATVQVVLDPSDTCGTPFSITDLAAVVEGTVEVASRQEWRIGYTFAP